MEKLKSRKLLVFIAVTLFIALNDALQLHISNADIIAIATMAVGYIGGQAYVDAKQPSVVAAEPLKMMTLDTSVQAQTEAPMEADGQVAVQDQPVQAAPPEPVAPVPDPNQEKLDRISQLEAQLAEIKATMQQNPPA